MASRPARAYLINPSESKLFRAFTYATDVVKTLDTDMGSLRGIFRKLNNIMNAETLVARSLLLRQEEKSVKGEGEEGREEREGGGRGGIDGAEQLRDAMAKLDAKRVRNNNSVAEAMMKLDATYAAGIQNGSIRADSNVSSHGSSHGGGDEGQEREQHSQDSTGEEHRGGGRAGQDVGATFSPTTTMFGDKGEFGDVFPSPLLPSHGGDRGNGMELSGLSGVGTVGGTSPFGEIPFVDYFGRVTRGGQFVDPEEDPTARDAKEWHALHASRLAQEDKAVAKLGKVMNNLKAVIRELAVKIGPLKAKLGVQTDSEHKHPNQLAERQTLLRRLTWAQDQVETASGECADFEEVVHHVSAERAMVAEQRRHANQAKVQERLDARTAEVEAWHAKKLRREQRRRMRRRSGGSSSSSSSRSVAFAAVAFGRSVRGSVSSTVDDSDDDDSDLESDDDGSGFAPAPRGGTAPSRSERGMGRRGIGRRAGHRSRPRPQSSGGVPRGGWQGQGGRTHPSQAEPWNGSVEGISRESVHDMRRRRSTATSSTSSLSSTATYTYRPRSSGGMYSGAGGTRGGLRRPGSSPMTTPGRHTQQPHRHTPQRIILGVAGARRKSPVSRAQANRAAVEIQRTVRGNQHRAMYLDRIGASMQIQALYRGFSHRQRLVHVGTVKSSTSPWGRNGVNSFLPEFTWDGATGSMRRTDRTGRSTALLTGKGRRSPRSSGSPVERTFEVEWGPSVREGGDGDDGGGGDGWGGANAPLEGPPSSLEGPFDVQCDNGTGAVARTYEMEWPPQRHASQPRSQPQPQPNVSGEGNETGGAPTPPRTGESKSGDRRVNHVDQGGISNDQIKHGSSAVSFADGGLSLANIEGRCEVKQEQQQQFPGKEEDAVDAGIEGGDEVKQEPAEEKPQIFSFLSKRYHKKVEREPPPRQQPQAQPQAQPQNKVLIKETMATLGVTFTPQTQGDVGEGALQPLVQPFVQPWELPTPSALQGLQASPELSLEERIEMALGGVDTALGDAGQGGGQGRGQRESGVAKAGGGAVRDDGKVAVEPVEDDAASDHSFV
jgi:hypothetical protein